MILILLNSFFEFYSIILNPKTCPISNFIVDSGNHYFQNCIFSHFFNPSNGGALYLYRTTTNLLIEETIFETCISSSMG